MPLKRLYHPPQRGCKGPGHHTKNCHAFQALGLEKEKESKFQRLDFWKIDLIIRQLNMGVSLNGGTPKTPQNDHF